MAIFVSRIFHINDLFYLYEITVFLRIILIAAGTQLFLNHIIPEIKKYWYFTFFVALLSSFTINSYHQNGAFILFGYLPFILLFIIKFFDNQSWFNILMLTYFSAISMLMYHSGYVALFVAIFIIVFLSLNGKYLKVIADNKLKIFVSFVLFILLTAPVWSIIFYKPLLYPYARMVYNPGLHNAPIFFSSPDEFKKTLAAFGTLGDILSLGLLPIAKTIYKGSLTFSLCKLHLPLTEMNMFIGFVPFILGIVGIIKGKNRFKPLFLIILFLSIFLFLGPTDYNLIYKALFYIFPPIRLIENTHEISTYLIFFYFYFVSLGFAYLISKIRKSWIKMLTITIVFIIVLLELSLYIRAIYNQGGPFSLLKRSEIEEKKISSIDKTNAEEIIFPNVSAEEKAKFIKYYQKQPDGSYKLKDSVDYEKDEIKDIIKKFFLLDINFKLPKKFEFHNERIKTLLPYSYVTNGKSYYCLAEENNISDRKLVKCDKFTTGAKDLLPFDADYFYQNSSSDFKIRLNLLGAIKQIPTATDYFSDFPYEMFKILPPNSLVLSNFYADIMESSSSQDLKQILLGVNLPSLEFYTDFKFLTPKEILDPIRNKEIIYFLSKGVILHNDSGNLGDSIGGKTGEINKHFACIKVFEYIPHRIKLYVDNNERGALLFRDGYDPSWKVKVDGSRKPLLRANYNQKAVFIEKGKHIVEFIFEPIIFMVSLYFYIAGSAIIVVFCIIKICIRQCKIQKQ